MAKKNKDANGAGAGSKIAGIIIIILALTTFLSVMALLIKCDVGGFGSNVLRPIFKNVPVIKEILPPPSDEEVAIESDYPYDTLEKALNQIQILESSVGSKDAEIVSLSDRVKELEAEVVRLTQFETDQKEFEEEKKKFYDEVVYGESAPDTDTYIEWYNSLDAEYAEKVYREVISANEVDQATKDVAAAYEAMDAKDAAEILENMKNDLDTVALILNNMSAESQGKILAEMDPEFAALVSKKLLP
ncbi:MAG: hypothetical protein NC225_00845 [Clostridium sp.]|nr:hypothetical protein [Clostridium sp.]MCM1398007.1 hypothetical protein [Clostridium sp.]MCM1459357.1 hypothetical protein [Bacteroides sp.]